MTFYHLKNHNQIIVVTDNLEEAKNPRFSQYTFRPVYSMPNHYWSALGNWSDVLTFIGIETSGQIDYAYPQNYSDDRMRMDSNVHNLGSPFWDYRAEKTHAIGLPLYKSEIIESLSTLIRFMIEINTYVKKYTLSPDTNTIQEIKD